MAHDITIDDQVFALLETRARPLVDTPNSVLRRLLGLEGTPESDSRLGDRPSGAEGPELPVSMGARRNPLPVTPQREFRRPIREALLAAGGGRNMEEVLSEVERQMRSRFRAGDLAPVSTGEIRWRNAARWERMQMAKEGLIKRGTPQGWWELTDDGSSS